MPGGGVRPGTEVVVTEHELLGKPAVERDDRVVVDLRCQCWVVTHRVVHPGIAVVGLVEVRRRGDVDVLVDHRAPTRQAAKIEVGGLVLLQEDDHPMSCHSGHYPLPFAPAGGRRSDPEYGHEPRPSGQPHSFGTSLIFASNFWEWAESRRRSHED